MSRSVPKGPLKEVGEEEEAAEGREEAAVAPEAPQAQGNAMKIELEPSLKSCLNVQVIKY